jgi:hypothetical protein
MQPPPGQVPGQPPYGYPGGQPGGQPGGGKKSNAGVIVAVVVVLAAAGGGLFVALGGGGGGVSDDGKTYTLTTPEEVAGLTLDFPMGEDLFTEAQATGLGVRRNGDAGGIYSAQSPAGDSAVARATFGGLHGTVEDPEAAVDAFFSSGAGPFTEEGDAALTGEVRSVSPEGSDNSVMKCQVLENTGEPVEGQTNSAPLCAWADYDTFGFVLADRAEAEDGTGTVEPLGIDAAADFAGAMRAAAVVETGADPSGSGDGGPLGDSGGSAGDLGDIPLPPADDLELETTGGFGDSGEVYGDIEIPGPSTEDSGF